jgi:hypothetical protein
MHVAQTFGVIAAVLTCLAMILVIVSLVHDFGSDTKNMIWKCIQVFYPCATVSQSLTFLAFASDSCRKLREDFNCTIGPVGVVAVVNVFLLLILMVIALRTPPPIPLTEESERFVHDYNPIAAPEESIRYYSYHLPILIQQGNDPWIIDCYIPPRSGFDCPLFLP